ncbi:MAG: serine/threonine protein kinase [Lachnospiraceae bacterium]|nr:serine/threonine protein kinase [Lachnospiraceae bacterium]
MENDVISKVWPEWSIVKKIGKGAYGVVYEAKRVDHAVESQAAIKVITIPENESELASLRAEGLSEDDTRKYLEGIVNDFVGEIQLMESFKGVQNIVSVEDYKVEEKPDGEIGWTIYIRMELLTPFNNIISERSLTQDEVIKLGLDISTALELCARQKVIHRDIKPENIFVNKFGDYKLGDFGIARKLENVTGGLSQKGTYNYMAPEVEKGKQYDLTVDIYSLGLVLYRMLNHNLLPFLTAENQLSPEARMAAVRKRLDGEVLPPPAECSPALSEIILKACAYNPSDRYQSASEMKQALERVKAGQDTEDEDILNKTMSVRHAQAGAGAQSGMPDPDMTTAVRHKAPEANTARSDGETKNNIFTGEKKLSLTSPKILAAIAAGVILLVVIVVFAAKGGKNKNEDPGNTTSVVAKTPTTVAEPTDTPKPTDEPEPKEPTTTPVPTETPAPTETPEEEPTEDEAVEAILKEARASAKDGDDLIALSIVQRGKKQYPDNEKLSEAYDSYAASYKEKTLAEANEKADSGDIAGAMAKIAEASAALPEDKEIQAMAKEIEDAFNELTGTGTEKDPKEDTEDTGKTKSDGKGVYLFDYYGAAVTNAYLCMINNDPNQSQITPNAWGLYPYQYDNGWKMESGGKTYKKGMAITPASGYFTEVYYSDLDAKYDKLTGMIAFEDKGIERVDKAYTIEFYTDGDLAASYKLKNNNKPLDIDVDLNKCRELSIILYQPSGDYSMDPNINLLEFKVNYSDL